jgi:hypothetical protein
MENANPQHVAAPRTKVLLAVSPPALGRMERILPGHDVMRVGDDAQDNARIRRIIDYLILIDGDLQQIKS